MQNVNQVSHGGEKQHHKIIIFSETMDRQNDI